MPVKVPSAVPSVAKPLGKVLIRTHGCKLNQADSDVIARQFIEAGYRLVNSVSEADVFVLNTCTVTANADSKARQALRAARRANPTAIIVAAGCYPQRAAQELHELDAVSLVIDNTQKDELVSQVVALHRSNSSSLALVDPNPIAPNPVGLEGPNVLPLVAAGTRRSRAMIKIQEGCDQVCAYCIVPKVRGRERSIPPETLIGEINRRTEEGFQEVVLTGTQLGTYGFDLPQINLVGLLRRILAETAVPRIRVSSLQPQEISAELLRLWEDSRLCPHFHVPLQSGSDSILKAMRRRYDTARFGESVELIREFVPDPGITTDLIVGFPGEGEAEFRQSREFAAGIGFSDMHIFPYSRRPGTSAHHLNGQVGAAEKRPRMNQMLEIASRTSQEFRRKQLGHIRPVLWESCRESGGTRTWSGLTDNYIRVYAVTPRDLRKTITPARMTALDGSGVASEAL
ncbi:MAG: tRNA (N(6)-L-threonylcarbamoyladenosine(37)-C(2))-methylthiotransferase MtaB [Chloroflexi bacterium]|nr:tRNA (N(6)-L-threonylcarbamoyladenosine(37)-C(2))-methylthiotransferase MtaB [Chloroflexota bacterium]